MSAPMPAQPVSLVEMDGRVAEMEAQRTMAQNRCIVLAGRVAELMDLLKIHRAENDRLLNLLNDSSAERTDGCAAAAVPIASASL